MEAQFTITRRIDGFSYHAIFKYYSPKNYSDDQLDDVDIRNRRELFDFKEGMNTSRVADLVSTAILQKTTRNFNHRSAVFMVIPAPTQSIHVIRYKLFCEIMAKKLGISNGYHGIMLLYDRDESDYQVGEDKIGNLSFDNTYFIDKAVVLFSDLIVTGDSFRQVANKLIDLGALKVTGAMLGETVAWDIDMD